VTTQLQLININIIIYSFTLKPSQRDTQQLYIPVVPRKLYTSGNVLTSIREMPGSNLGRNTDCPEVLHVFCSLLYSNTGTEPDITETTLPSRFAAH